MKNVISKNRFLLALICFVVLSSCVLGLATIPNANAEQTPATSIQPMAFKETSTNDVKYDSLERINYVYESGSAVIGEDFSQYPGVNTTYQGVVGKTAIRKTYSDTRNIYQIYFSNCFESKKTYEISFWVKTVDALGSFYVEVRYASDDKKVDTEVLPRISSTDGQWQKYSFTFESNASLKEQFKLTLSFKNWYVKDSNGEITSYNIGEVYYDQFSAVLVDDGYNPYISGEKFSVQDWTTAVASENILSFNGENYPAGVKTTTGQLVSKIFEAPQSGLFRLRFAIKRTTGATVSLSVKNALGNTVDSVDLTSDSLFSYYDFTTSNLSEHSFVYLQFDTTCQDASDYAIIGLVEMVSHTHDVAIQPSGYPKYDFANCTTTRCCNSCQLELVDVHHNFEITQQPTCGTAGKKVCQNQECGLTIVLPATENHASYVDRNTRNPVDDECNANNQRMAVICAECGGGNKYLSKSHNFECVYISDTEHQTVCKNCGFAEDAQQHATSNIVVAKNPSQTENGFAVIYCELCDQKHGLDLPNLADENAWTMSVIAQETCTDLGRTRYTFNAQPAIFAEYDVEALGHDYQAIKQMPTCTEDGISLHHKCETCGYVKETPEEIKELSAYGHDLADWIVEKEPTLEQDGLRKVYCTRCEVLVEQQVIPKLDEINYTKYALDDHDESKGFYYYYSSNEWGTYPVFVEGTNQDDVTVMAICISCAVVVCGSITAYCIIATKAKKKKVK